MSPKPELLHRWRLLQMANCPWLFMYSFFINLCLNSRIVFLSIQLKNESAQGSQSASVTEEWWWKCHSRWWTDLLAYRIKFCLSAFAIWCQIHCWPFIKNKRIKLVWNGEENKIIFYWWRDFIFYYEHRIH